jgi:hypothetical protein
VEKLFEVYFSHKSLDNLQTYAVKSTVEFTFLLLLYFVADFFVKQSLDEGIVRGRIFSLAGEFFS